MSRHPLPLKKLMFYVGDLFLKLGSEINSKISHLDLSIPSFTSWLVDGLCLPVGELVNFKLNSKPFSSKNVNIMSSRMTKSRIIGDDFYISREQ